MPTGSFCEDLIIDTPEAAADLTELFESGVYWKRGDPEYTLIDADTYPRMIAKNE